ncbi:uncharacterized protein LOC112272038 [Brachypodium distachyon]|uniref:Uncharacterized protein n=1 Tax=Brachypodium distachyon TaxID=15368 RepID=A0A2K2CZ95_BRADI|nr:uncharacterized protein LOC112272038 [Brachypodium distachyon]PNT67352.1 hypothetical protein BRADI_3g25790v3 [Brachypodium distachyon]|eukprot:XP_024318328.1 uncharacterized protein LOC112272038 [Brachypodium distachyon]
MSNCETTQGFPEVLREIMRHIGFRYQPEYTVFEDYRDFNQEYYRVVVRLHQDMPSEKFPVHKAVGTGHTIELAIQQVAYMCVTLLRMKYERLDKGPFKYIPRGFIACENMFFTLPGLPDEKVANDSYDFCNFVSSQEHMMANMRAKVEHYRKQLWIALGHLSAVVDAGMYENGVRYPPSPLAPELLHAFPVDGFTTTRGPPRVFESTYLPRQFLYGEQKVDAYVFPYSPQLLPRF